MGPLRPVCIAFSTYSIIPMPQFEWDERSLRYSLAALPLVGAVIGAAMYGLSLLLSFLNAGTLLSSALLAFVPALISGGIHLDGFLDTADALSSRVERERALKILKDSRCGAFAVIYCVFYILITAGVMGEIAPTPAIYPACFGYCMSRSLGAMTALLTKSARSDGMLAAFTSVTDRRVALSVLSAAAFVCAALMIWLSLPCGLCALALLALWLPLYRRIALTRFGGVTGDTTGFFITVCELLTPLGCLIGLYIGRLL